jgi:hypothetical protein
LTGRNEKLAVRVQIFENLRANSRAIWRKLSRIWADQAILQSAHGKPDSLLDGFCPETALFRNLYVNLRPYLCGVPVYASAQDLDFLDLTKNSSLPNQKLVRVHPEFPDGL